MGRGKIEIKKIENPTNRQVTYSKRRNGIFKKAQELTVLCDAEVSLLMVSTTGKIHEYTSPNTSMKKMYDQYQTTLNTDIWSTHYEKMQEYLRKLREINNRLRREIGQKMGEDLEDLSFQQLVELDQQMAESVAIIRARKYHVLQTQTNTCNKKVKSMIDAHGKLALNFLVDLALKNEVEKSTATEAICEDPAYGMVESDQGTDYDNGVAYDQNGAANMYTYRLQMNGQQPNHSLHGGEGSYGFRDLRLS